MPEDKNSSTVDFLNNLPLEGDVFKEEPTAVVAEERNEEDEKPLPFHRDPKVMRFVQKQIDKALEDRPVEKQFIKEVTEDINLPSSFIKLVGNDTDEKKQVLKDLSEYFGGLKGEAKKEFLQEMEQQQQRAAEEDRAAVTELAQGFEEIEETFGVDLTSNTASAQKLDNDFRAFIRKIAPKNEQGEVSAFPDLVSAFEEFQERSKLAQRPSRAKELASRGLARSTDTGSAPQQGTSWRDVEKFFDKLKN